MSPPRLISTHVPTMLNSPGVSGRELEKLKQIRFGNQVKLSPVGGPQLDCWREAGADPGWDILVSKPQLLWATSILRVSAQDLLEHAFQPGSWVLTLNAYPSNVNESPFYEGDYLVSPLIARITFGTGAAAHVIEIDAINSSIALPSMDVLVEVGISQIVGAQVWNGIAEDEFGLYSEYTFTAVIQKTSNSVESKATRSLIVNKASALVPIPEFANEWCYIPQAYAPAFGDPMFEEPTSFWSRPDGLPNIAGNGSDRMLELVPTDICDSMARNHCFRPIHPFANSAWLTTFSDTGEISNFPGTFICTVGI